MLPLIAVTAVILILFLVKQLFLNTSGNKELLNMAHEINRSCPVMIDEDTRLDSASTFPDNTLQYNYTLVNVLKDSIDTHLFQTRMKHSILKAVRTDPKLKLYRDNKVTMVYYYQDKAGHQVTKITITPEKYGRK